MFDTIKKLEQFARPARYIGGEINAVVKDESEVDLRVALAFPEVYEIGMSHLGLKILYGMINQTPNFWAERVMAPWIDLENELRRRGLPLTGLESGRPLAEFDLIGFSLQSELTFTNVLNMLDLAGIPLLASERGEKAPLIVGGGPCAANPEPVADFFDFFYLGEAEAGFLDILNRITDWKSARGSKPELLAALAGQPGIYIPSLFKPAYDSENRLIEITPLRSGYERIERAFSPDLNSIYCPDRPIVPSTKPVHDRLALEIARGCTRGCRFCQAGFIYRPVRERKPADVLDLAGRCLDATGLSEVSLLSLSSGDYSCLVELMTAFMDIHAARHIALSLPSLRVKSLTPELMRQIKRVRKTGFTLAPEAATQRLRDVINKDLSDDDLIRTANDAFSLGWRLIKLYFMIGLPTETEEDVTAIADLASSLKKGSRSQINVSFAAFIPKAQTPFQWEAMLDLDEINRKMDILIRRLKGRGLKPKWNQPVSSLIEGILARGDRRLAPVLRKIQARGGRFDGWTEQIRPELWFRAMAEENMEIKDYLRAREVDEVLPWSHLNAGADSDYLRRERDRAYQGLTTPDCREGSCGQCGVCDFKEIRPRLGDPAREAAALDTISVQPAGDSKPKIIKRVQINYAKEGPARFLSHLETVDVFVRALRRIGLEIRSSQGFHPMPKISFASPLPVGLTSRDEYLEVELIEPPEVNKIRLSLSQALPRGFKVLDLLESPLNQARPKAVGSKFHITAREAVFSSKTYEQMNERSAIIVTKQGKKGTRRIDLKPLIRELKVLTGRELEITLLFGVRGSVRAEEAVQTLFNLSPDQVEDLTICKLQTLFS